MATSPCFFFFFFAFSQRERLSLNEEALQYKESKGKINSISFKTTNTLIENGDSFKNGRVTSPESVTVSS